MLLHHSTIMRYTMRYTHCFSESMSQGSGSIYIRHVVRVYTWRRSDELWETYTYTVSVTETACRYGPVETITRLAGDLYESHPEVLNRFTASLLCQTLWGGPADSIYLWVHFSFLSIHFGTEWNTSIFITNSHFLFNVII